MADSYWFGSTLGSTYGAFGGYSQGGTAIIYHNSGDQAAGAAAQAQAYAEYKSAMEKKVQEHYVMRLVAELTKFEDVEAGLV